MAGELIIKNGIQVSGSITAYSITGSFSGSFTGVASDATSASFSSTASFASTASYALTSSYTPTLDQVTTAGNTTTNTITVGKLNAGDSATILNTERALNLVSTNAAMRILRISPDSLTASPSIEIIHRTTPDGTNTAYWDIFLSTLGLTIRNRTTSATNVLTASPNNNVLIGTTTDSGYKLDVNGTGIIRSKLAVGNSVTALNTERALNLVSTDAVIRILRISANSVTASPSVELMHRTTSDGVNTVYWDFYASSDGFFIRNRYDGTGTNVNVLNATPNNNVLIGTTTDAGYKLDVNGTARVSGNLTITGSATNSLLVKGSGATNATNTLLIQNNAGTQLGYIDDSGQWMVGAGTNGGYKLDVNGTGRFSSNLTITGSTDITGSLGVIGTATVSGSIIVQGGSTGIVSTGTTNATEAFKVQNATPEVLFNVKDDGELNINTTKYANNGILENNGGIIQEIQGFSGPIIINTTPPVTINVQNGVIVSVT